MTRQDANRTILEELRVLVETFPDWRFQQLLWGADVTLRGPTAGTTLDLFHEESTVTLERVEAAVDDLLGVLPRP